MTVTVPSLLQPMKDRLAAATEGPWKTVRHDLSLYVEAESGELNPINLGYVGNRPERNGDFIAAAPTDQAKLIAAIEQVAGPVDALMAQLVAREARWKAAWESGELTHDEAVSATQEDRWAYGELAAIRFALTRALGGDTA
jgi:hypothetical protein